MRLTPLFGSPFAATAQAATVPHENNAPAQSTQKPQPRQQVTGTVVDTEGEALAGVTLRVKGTTQGTTTDAKGRFTLQVKQGAVLQVSYIGYERQEVTVSGTQLNLTLKPNDNSLNEAVVIGYGTVRKGRFGRIGGRDGLKSLQRPTHHPRERRPPRPCERCAGGQQWYSRR